MGTPASALVARSPAVAVPLRVLHAWHLLSLDAPTVAFLWTLLLARSGHVPHPLPSAVALACAVWLVYVADRLLDARVGCNLPWSTESTESLPALYVRQGKAFLSAGACLAIGTSALLAALPHPLVKAWLLLCVPLLAYGLAVHALHLANSWKTVGVGAFFGVAAVLPLAVHGGGEWQRSALLFASVCVLNGAVLRATGRTVHGSFAGCVAIAASALRYPDLRLLAAASVCASLLMLWLWWGRRQLEPITYRALVDAALAISALVMLVR